MFKKIALVGLNSMSLRFIYWVRKITPRIKVDIYDINWEKSDIISPRRIKYLGQPSKAVLFPEKYRKYLLLYKVKKCNNDIEKCLSNISKKYDYVIHFKEPVFTYGNIKIRVTMVDDLKNLKKLSKNKTAAFLNDWLSIQLAIYLKNKGFNTCVVENELSKILPKDLSSKLYEFLREKFTCKKDYEIVRYDNHPYGEFSIFMYENKILTEKIDPFLDENIEQYIALSVMKVLGLDSNKLIHVNVIEDTIQNTYFYINNYKYSNSTSYSSTRISVDSYGFIRFLLDKKDKVVKTIYGILDNSSKNMLREAILLFLSESPNENFPLLALSKTPLFQGDPILASLLALWRKSLDKLAIHAGLMAAKI